MKIVKERPLVFDAALMMILVAANAIFQILRKDLVASMGGLGWDGVLYAWVVQDPSMVFQMIPERVQRILPSIVISSVLQILHISKTNSNVIFAFQIFNALSLVTDVLAYIALARYFHFSRSARWLGFFPLFFFFGNAKLLFHNPVLTDAFGFSLALWGTLFVLKRDLIKLFFILLLASFTWSTLTVWLLPLLIFPVQKAKDLNDEERSQSTKGAMIAAFAAMLAYLGGVYLSYNVLGYRPYVVALQVQEQWLLISEIVGALYVYAGFYFLFRYFSVSWPMIRTAVSLKGLAVYVAAMLLGRIILMLIVRKQGGAAILTPFREANSIFMRSVTVPGIFLVSHAVYYGPIFIFTLFFWKDICRQASRMGYGALAFLGLTLLFSITSESRHLLHAYPLIVCLCLVAIEQRNLQKALLPLTAIVTLIASKIWYRITIQMFQGFVKEGFLIDPMQRYYMHLGPWMSIQHYMIQGGIALLFSGVVFLIIRRARRPVRVAIHT